MELEIEKKRFASINSDELEKLLHDKDSENTRKSTKVSVDILRKYLVEKGKSDDFLASTQEELNMLLKQFYVETRRMDQSEYSKSSMVAIRFGLCRFIKAHTPEVDIINGSEFDEANRVFKAKIVDLKKKGKAKVQHKPQIATEDLRKLYRSVAFDEKTPTGLQNKTWFELMMYFCRRGRENLRELTKESFGIGVDASGKRYVYQIMDELTKNRREEHEAEEGGFMYENPGTSCPVMSFEKYISKLNPSCNALFQRPKKIARDAAEMQDVWYDNQVVGINTLANKMKVISKQAQLSNEYTNHSIRATSVTILDQNGFEARHIMCVSGHKQESSIRSYSNKTTDSMKFAMSNAIGTTISSNPPHLSNSNNSVIAHSNHQPILKEIQNTSQTLIHADSSKPTQFNFTNCTVTINHH